ncbi:hypothetical protein [Gemmatimonas groenlandica]|uniref:Uncharacterized protein n=1 Tax=Gemmatimonas groenlandica TaxID=2732249 RepID=A0A6M4IJX3_9BACT|nr:hypothetical protein [Gemmatimonas groenlandica]QJR34148.1 hypothetical protein HKW67_00775 [Gemmatimonas groenlandica]
MTVPELPPDQSTTTGQHDAERTARTYAAHVLAWVRGHGPVPAPHSVSRLAHDAIQSLRVERELALADRRHRAPAEKTPVMPRGIMTALLDPTLIDLRHHDVVQLHRSPTQYFVAFDPTTDELLSWEMGDPGRVKRWGPSVCRGDVQLASLLRAGREARYPWVYPDVAAAGVVPPPAESN